MQNESISYLMLFCALVVARKHRVPLQEAVMVAPVSGGARLLAGKLLEQNAVAG